MPRTVEIKVFKFNELSDKAKERARKWWLESGLDEGWHEGTYEDAKSVGALMGVAIDNIFFSGFWSQGDGACFEGSFIPKEGSLGRVKEYAPKDEVLHDIAKRWDDLHRMMKLSGKVKHSGRYSHEQCTSFEVWCEEEDGLRSYEFSTDDSYVRDNPESGAEAVRILRDFMKWIYRQLEQAYEDYTSEENIAEAIEINEYEFTEDGEYSHA